MVLSYSELTRDEAVQQIVVAWSLELGGDETFRRAYDALWANGPSDLTAENFFEQFMWMKRLLPKLHDKDLSMLWKISCG